MGSVERRLLVGVLVVLVAGCAGDQQSERTAADTSPTQTEPLESKFTVSLEETNCTSTIPQRLPRAPFVVEFRNRAEGVSEFSMGFYGEGYDHGDIVGLARENDPGIPSRPGWMIEIVDLEVLPDVPLVERLELEPGRYFAVCLVSAFNKLDVLPDVVIED